MDVPGQVGIGPSIRNQISRRNRRAPLPLSLGNPMSVGLQEMGMTGNTNRILSPRDRTPIIVDGNEINRSSLPPIELPIGPTGLGQPSPNRQISPLNDNRQPSPVRQPSPNRQITPLNDNRQPSPIRQPSPNRQITPLNR